MIDLVVLDIDGTIVGQDGVVPAGFRHEVERTRAAGIRVAVCTGRPRPGPAGILACELGPDHPHVFQGGALLAHPDGTVVAAELLPPTAVTTLVTAAGEGGYTIELYTVDTARMSGTDAAAGLRADEQRPRVSRVELAGFAQTNAVIRVVILTDRTAPELDLGPDVERSTAYSIQLASHRYESYIATGVDKGSGISHLAEFLGCRLERTMAVGDDIADMAMLDRVGYPLAMANAVEPLRRRFPTVPPVEEGGVLYALRLARDGGTP